MRKLPKFLQDFLNLFNRMKRARKIIEDIDYERNRAIMYGEQYGAWIAEYHLWKNIDTERAQRAMNNAEMYLHRVKRYAEEMFVRYSEGELDPSAYE